eukprot:8251646-Lingulodinium_polyedra.AAC.1
MAIFHGQQIQDCEAPGGTVSWYSRMASGAFWKPVMLGWGLLNDLAKLEQTGFACTPLAAKALCPSPDWQDSPLVKEESLW